MHLPLFLNDESAPSEENKKAFSKPLKIGLIIGVAVILIGYAGTFAWAKSYENRLAPRTSIDSIKLSGDNPDQAKQKINTRVDEILLNGLQLSVDGQLRTVPLSPTAAETGEYIIFDVNQAIEDALSKQRGNISVFQPFVFLYTIIRGNEIKLPVSINEEGLRAAILNTFPDSIQEPLNAGFSFKQNGEEWTVEVTPSAKGFTIPTAELFYKLRVLLAELDPQPIVLTRAYEEPTIIETDVAKLSDAAMAAVVVAPYTITYEDQTWKVDAATLTPALQPLLNKDKELILSVSADGLKPLFDEIAIKVEKPAVDARIAMENERITDFQGSSNGVAIDREATAAALSDIIQTLPKITEVTEINKNAELVVVITEPTVKMESINNFGIKEVLGVGTSNYKGSPTNRIKNIRNGVRLLNGILIKPGEEFSLLKALSPFNTTNGYLAELVIKGDKIEPEVGGGLCQIGTTTFRAAMNSGLPVTERRNHSLVVSYYNDPTNNKPGTDATIYEPAPDLKFINDTGNYIIFQAEMDEVNYDLYFSFWGTSDGRKGSYTPPTLIRWIGVGEDQRTETLDLAPGVEQCQHAYVGADTTFTYTIERADGTKEETVFDSHYRPLPKICLVGVEELTPTPEETTDETTIPTEEPVVPLAE
ncbi:MAG: VanW family protein [Patescibacteria group bacterium]|jgi:vancomycin resistance protein YoaR